MPLPGNPAGRRRRRASSREPGDLPARVAHHPARGVRRADHRSGDDSCVVSRGRAGDVRQGAQRSQRRLELPAPAGPRVRRLRRRPLLETGAVRASAPCVGEASCVCRHVFNCSSELRLRVFPACPTRARPAADQLPGHYVQGATLETPRRLRPAKARPSETAPAPAAASERRRRRRRGVPARAIGNAVTVVTGEELRAQQIRHAADALRSLPGVSVSRSGGFGSVAQVRIRGAEGNHTLVLIDGIEANNTADGEFDFSNLSAEDIERIEIIRGPHERPLRLQRDRRRHQHHHTTRQGPVHRSRVRAEGGSLGTHDVCARVSGGNDRRIFLRLLQLARRATASISLRSAARKTAGALARCPSSGGATLLKGVTLDFIVRHTRKASDRDGFGGIPQALLAHRRHRRSLHPRHHVFLAGVKLRWDTLDGALTQEFRVNHNALSTGETDVRPFRERQQEHQRGATSSPTSPPIGSTCHVPAAKHAYQRPRREGGREIHAEGSFADGLERERGRVGLRRIAGRVRQAAVPDRPACATTTTTRSRTSPPGARLHRWCCRS